MVIDVKNVGSSKVTTTTTKSKKSEKTSDSDVNTTETSEDSVELTGKASQIQSLIKQMMAAPAVDRSRVDPVKEKIEEGRYEIETERVANKMLDFEASYSKVR
ncbi:flagellar biosynthesis anti-sigma factor FlgM [Pleionea sediminis]|uniref:flagellar biosynthesis anti-sigma factor FlgM n=1 Tax=Pleionea sediminis TaxID=2569479 RepID=UPI001186F1EA|nr:flagellar biosynthesis anti-sigma factor FlgM [Pleionea sediminis]